MASPQDRFKMAIDHLWSYRNFTIWIIFVTALAAFIALPLAAQKGYMDEKALVVGAMGLSIHEIQGADSIYNQLKKENDLHDVYSLLSRASELSIEHTATEILPPPPIWHQNKNSSNPSCKCHAATTVHAVIPGGRGDGTEAILLVLPITAAADSAQLTAAIGVQAARHLSSVSWLAKNLAIVFLQVEEENNTDTLNCSHSTALEALESWLRCMDLTEAKTAPKQQHQVLGLIQQGIILDIRSIAATEARISVHGYYGQLPNLDLVVLSKKNLEFYTNFPHGVGLDVGRTPAVKTHLGLGLRNDINTLRQRIRTSVSFSGYLALGKPTGAHAALLHRGADALGITLTRPDLPNVDSLSGDTSAKIKESDVLLTARNALNAIEMIVRTCNNLHERLHHANALYILIDADHFVNVGACMVPPGLLLASLLLVVAQYVPNMSIKSRKEKKGALIVVVVHAAAALITVLSLQFRGTFNFSISNQESGRLLHVVSTILAGVLVSIKIGGRWTQHLSSAPAAAAAAAAEEEEESTKITETEVESGTIMLQSFISVCSILVLIEAAALLLWRWALSFTLLALTVPLLHLLSSYTANK
jgi:hypothetical protein